MHSSRHSFELKVVNISFAVLKYYLPGEAGLFDLSQLIFCESGSLLLIPESVACFQSESFVGFE